MALIQGTHRNDTLRGTEDADQIYGYENHDRLYGNGGDDYLSGADGDDTLVGGTGNDTLEGNIGIDSMRGGIGDDVYYVYEADDIVIENSGNGEGTNDYVFSFVDGYILASNVENLQINGGVNSNTSGEGNNLDNFIEIRHFNRGQSSYSANGGSGNDTLSGSPIRDNLDGESGDDLLQGNNGGDFLWGDSGKDILKGGSGDDFLYGGVNNDELRGGEGDDYLSGNFDISNHDDIDRLFGDAGLDTFSIGITNQIFYSRGPGYAVIQDFNRSQDKIELAARNIDLNDYSLEVDNFDGVGGNNDTGIYYRDDLIGVVNNQTGLSLDDNYFIYDM